MKPLLVFAMPQESQTLFVDRDVIHTGIGKVNAAYALTKRLSADPPELVINLGTAGSRTHAGGCVINPTCFIQRDMDVTALGFEKYQTPFSDDPVRIEYGLEIEGVEHGICGTGDSFDISDTSLAFDVVDMEAYALALICQRENIPFLCLKYISDGADDGAEQDFNQALLVAAQTLKDTLEGAGY